MEEPVRFLVAMVGVAVGMWAMRRWVRRERRHLPDTEIDRLIRENAAKPRPGMHEMDWAAANKFGDQRFGEYVRAQRNGKLGRDGFQ